MLENALDQADVVRRLPSPPVRRALRERAGLTQQDLATALGVQRSTISRYESGHRKPRGRHATAYVTALDEIAAHIETQ